MIAQALWLYRRALSRASHEFRVGFLDEAVDDLSRALSDERRRRGAVAACWLWMRAMADAFGAARGDRQVSGTTVWHGLGQDLRESSRMLFRAGGYSAAVICTLALAIGGVTAVFRLADPMVFRRLPFPNAERLFEVSVSGGGTFGYNQLPDYVRAEGAEVFERMGAYFGPLIASSSASTDASDFLVGYAVTDGYLGALSVPSERGRLFLSAEYAAAKAESGMFDPGGPALITDGLWATEFGRREDVIGQALRLRRGDDVVALTVVGVLAKTFVLPDATNRAPSFLVPGRLDLSKQGSKRAVVGILARIIHVDV